MLQIYYVLTDPNDYLIYLIKLLINTPILKSILNSDQYYSSLVPPEAESCTYPTQAVQRQCSLVCSSAAHPALYH